MCDSCVNKYQLKNSAKRTYSVWFMFSAKHDCDWLILHQLETVLIKCFNITDEVKTRWIKLLWHLFYHCNLRILLVKRTSQSLTCHVSHPLCVSPANLFIFVLIHSGDDLSLDANMTSSDAGGLGDEVI